MPKHPKRPRDLNQLAYQIVQEATGEAPVQGRVVLDSAFDDPPKNPAAVALGKLGASKGGVARAKKLSPEKRREIAKHAVETRWNNRQNPKS